MSSNTREHNACPQGCSMGYLFELCPNYATQANMWSGCSGGEIVDSDGNTVGECRVCRGFGWVAKECPECCTLPSQQTRMHALNDFLRKLNSREMERMEPFLALSRLHDERERWEASPQDIAKKQAEWERKRIDQERLETAKSAEHVIIQTVSGFGFSIAVSITVGFAGRAFLGAAADWSWTLVGISLLCRMIGVITTRVSKSATFGIASGSVSALIALGCLLANPSDVRLALPVASVAIGIHLAPSVSALLSTRCSEKVTSHIVIGLPILAATAVHIGLYASRAETDYAAKAVVWSGLLTWIFGSWLHKTLSRRIRLKRKPPKWPVVSMIFVSALISGIMLGVLAVVWLNFNGTFLY